ncbi:hypothetical protein CVT25_004308, partial [Psilocybe cyanescens]
VSVGECKDLVSGDKGEYEGECYEFNEAVEEEEGMQTPSPLPQPLKRLKRAEGKKVLIPPQDAPKHKLTATQKIKAAAEDQALQEEHRIKNMENDLVKLKRQHNGSQKAAKALSKCKQLSDEEQDEDLESKEEMYETSASTGFSNSIKPLTLTDISQKENLQLYKPLKPLKRTGAAAAQSAKLLHVSPNIFKSVPMLPPATGERASDHISSLPPLSEPSEPPPSSQGCALPSSDCKPFEESQSSQPVMSTLGYAHGTLGFVVSSFQLHKVLLPLKTKGSFYYKVYKDRNNLSGLCEAHIIPAIIQACWFENKTALGVVFKGYFNPIPLEIVASVLTVIDFCLEEWSTGEYHKVAMLSSLIEDRHVMYCKIVKNWRDVNPGYIDGVCCKVWKREFHHSRAVETVVPTIELSQQVMKKMQDEYKNRTGETDSEKEEVEDAENDEEDIE